MTAVQRFLDILQPQRLTEVVDVGAHPIDGAPPYQSMLDGGLCRVTGFEPQADGLAELQASSTDRERYLPWAIGDGEQHLLHLCAGAGMTSLLELDPVALELFPGLAPYAEVIGSQSLDTRRLDDVDEITDIDFLKMDVQGSELAVLRHGRKRLERCVVVQTEVSFVALYTGQTPFGGIDIELREQGFIPHCLAALKRWPIAPAIHGNTVAGVSNQLLEADVVYVRDFSARGSLDDEQLKHLALIAHHCYGSYDLALRCVRDLERRRALPLGSTTHYLALLRTDGCAA